MLLRAANPGEASRLACEHDSYVALLLHGIQTTQHLCSSGWRDFSFRHLAILAEVLRHLDNFTLLRRARLPEHESEEVANGTAIRN